jgi:putative inorganic carbon (HCO3(-)) transporter
MSSLNSFHDEKSSLNSKKSAKEASPSPISEMDYANRPFLFRSPKISDLLFVLFGILLAIAVALGINFTATYPSFLIVGAALALILAFIIFQKPELGAYILIFTVFTNLSDLFTEKGLPSINKPLVGIVLFSIFANYILRTGKINSSVKMTRVEVALLAYYLAILASSLVAINQSRALNSVFDLTKDIAVGFCIYFTLDTKEKLKTGARILLIAVTFVSILGIIHTLGSSNISFGGLAQQSAFGQTSDTGDLRYGGPIGESNIWGQVLVSILPIALYRIAREREPLAKMLVALSALCILIAMFFTESRGAFVALVVILALIAIDLRIKGTTLLALTSIGLVLLFIVPSRYTERIKSLDIFFQPNQEYGLSQDESVQGRREKMLTGLAMFRDNPFLGVGFANYTDNYWSYAGNLGLEAAARNVGSESSERQPHSLYIEVMAETGIFGITTFLAFLGLMLNGLYQARVKNNANKIKADKDWSAWITSIMMSIITFLVAGFFLHGIGFRFIWVLAGLAIAIVHLTQNQSSILPSKLDS